ncbi:MAG: hypothetical protein GY698_23790, partial [Actinomycetia bacterium]|nr:hypothetical protein [Actinomycetes bacterium]
GWKRPSITTGLHETPSHIRQLDAVLSLTLARAWAAGAGPGDGALVVDLDSTICEVHGKQKQAAGYGYTNKLGYHPLLATRAGTGEVLFARMRRGSANTARGVVRFVDELVANLKRAGASGSMTVQHRWPREQESNGSPCRAPDQTHRHRATPPVARLAPPRLQNLRHRDLDDRCRCIAPRTRCRRVGDP